MDFTIIIPTHNRHAMLQRALQSALRQTYDRFDIIVVDDASEPPAIVNASGAGRVTLLRSPVRRGAGGSRNLGAAHATGRWLVFLDDDDELAESFLQRMYDVLKDAPARQFAYCSIAIAHDDRHDRPVRESIHRLSDRHEHEDDLLAQTVSIGCGYGLTVNRAVFAGLGGFDLGYAATEDTEMLFRLIAAGGRPSVIVEPLVRVHDHVGERLTARASHRQRIAECALLRAKYHDLIADHPALGEYLASTIVVLSGRRARFAYERIRVKGQRLAALMGDLFRPR